MTLYPVVQADSTWIFTYQGEEPVLSYWRTAAGSEVDVVVETSQGLIPLEIKRSETLRPEMAKELVASQKDFGSKVRQVYGVYPGNMALPMGDGVVALHLAEL